MTVIRGALSGPADRGGFPLSTSRRTVAPSLGRALVPAPAGEASQPGLFPTTNKLLALIASAAITGDSITPSTGKSAPAASGISATL